MHETNPLLECSRSRDGEEKTQKHTTQFASGGEKMDGRPRISTRQAKFIDEKQRECGVECF